MGRDPKYLVLGIGEGDHRNQGEETAQNMDPKMCRCWFKVDRKKDRSVEEGRFLVKNNLDIEGPLVNGVGLK